MGKTTKPELKQYRMTFQVNTLLLITHICLLCLFAYFRVSIMVYMNICSILFYVVMYGYYKKNLEKYVFLVFVEVLIHMGLATVCVGWDAGFQLYAYCLIPCIFLCEYLSKTDGKKTMHPIPVSAVVVVCFLTARHYCLQHQAVYQLANPARYVELFIFNAVVTFAFLMLYMSIFTMRILSKEKQLADMAEMDELTKLPNRYLMREWLHEGYDNEKDTMAVAMLDIDNFKGFNDTYGHSCGDMVLRKIAGMIAAVSNERLRSCRWGGEEFVFLATGEHAYEYLEDTLEKLRGDVEKLSILFHNQEIRVTVTIGIAEYRREDISFHEILKRADNCLYEGKGNGKNCVVGQKAR